MPMTDDEAKKALECEIRVQSRGTEADVVPALRHALVAMADRAALCAREVSPLTWPDLHAQIDAARRHMEGEP